MCFWMFIVHEEPCYRVHGQTIPPEWSIISVCRSGTPFWRPAFTKFIKFCDDHQVDKITRREIPDNNR
ncbi:hypothetical protein VN97_g7646 [Penicillium thymicola]|uniref:Uncharacterized protein n=1 Tax=Penicillium thymicola TaxID=293382 RepID=A0AAI9X6M6_PENTH|nr:hypothetical protein VN97_g7646 [Penicillium thymicola]